MWYMFWLAVGVAASSAVWVGTGRKWRKQRDAGRNAHFDLYCRWNTQLTELNNRKYILEQDVATWMRRHDDLMTVFLAATKPVPEDETQAALDAAPDVGAAIDEAITAPNARHRRTRPTRTPA